MKTVEEKIVLARRVARLIEEELVRAWTKHPGEFHNAHEGYAVIREEFEVELFAEHICNDTAYTAAGMKEALQTAAMAVRYIVELHDHPTAERVRLKLLNHSDPDMRRPFDLVPRS